MKVRQVSLLFASSITRDKTERPKNRGKWTHRSETRIISGLSGISSLSSCHVCIKNRTRLKPILCRFLFPYIPYYICCKTVLQKQMGSLLINNASSTIQLCMQCTQRKEKLHTALSYQSHTHYCTPMKAVY